MEENRPSFSSQMVQIFSEMGWRPDQAGRTSSFQSPRVASSAADTLYVSGARLDQARLVHQVCAWCSLGLSSRLILVSLLHADHGLCATRPRFLYTVCAPRPGAGWGSARAQPTEPSRDVPSRALQGSVRSTCPEVCMSNHMRDGDGRYEGSKSLVAIPSGTGLSWAPHNLVSRPPRLTDTAPSHPPLPSVHNPTILIQSLRCLRGV